jgi:RNA recognition motif-containing protein
MADETVVEIQEQIQETVEAQANGHETNGSGEEVHANVNTEEANTNENGQNEANGHIDNGSVENGTTENGHSNGNENSQELVPEYFRKVFIGSLSYSTTDDAFRNYFGKYGTIIDCVIMKESKTNKSRGFGFVTYNKQACVDELMKARPHKLDNRELEIKRATPREDSGKPGAESTTKKVNSIVN